MRRRMIFLLILCGMLLIFEGQKGDTLPASAGVQSMIYVDMSAMSLTLYESGKVAGRWPIAVGAASTPSPLGIYRIVGRHIMEESVFGTRFIRLSVPFGRYGIHGTNQPGSIGQHASNGCIRMYTKDVEALFKRVYVGMPVIIEEGPYGEFGWSLQNLTVGDRSSQVLAAQKRLRALGYYEGSLDGIYGRAMLTAVRVFKEEYGLPAGDMIDGQVWEAMGVLLFE